jgi:hypothetical protein
VHRAATGKGEKEEEKEEEEEEEECSRTRETAACKPGRRQDASWKDLVLAMLRLMHVM